MDAAKKTKKPLKKSRLKIWRLVLLLLVLVGGAGAAWYFYYGPARQVSASSSTKIYTSKVSRGSFNISAKGSGTLVAANQVNVSFTASGIVSEVKVRVGDEVKTGDVLARLKNTEKLEATVASCELQLMTAQQSLNKIHAQSTVNLANTYQAWYTAQKDYDNAKTTKERSILSRCSGSVNNQNLIAMNKASVTFNDLYSCCRDTVDYEVAKLAYEKALANYNYCISLTPEEKTDADSNLKVAEMKLKQAEADYNAVKTASGIDPDTLAVSEATVQKARTQLDVAKQDLAGSILTAPINGTVISIVAGAGQMVDTATFIVLADMKNLNVQVSIGEADMGKFIIGNKVEVRFDAIPGRVYTGKVIQVDPSLTTSSNVRMVKGLVSLDGGVLDAKQRYPLGLNATVSVISQEVKNGILIPVEALRDLGDGQYAVFVQGTDQKLRLRVVEIGITDRKTYVEIRSGLNENELVSTGLSNLAR